MTDSENEAIETILQEIEHLQKENERYKRIKPVSIDGEYEIDLEGFLNVSNKLYELERNSISKDKIREKIEELSKEYSKSLRSKSSTWEKSFKIKAQIDILQDLLKEE